ncbi:alpha/beta hydrolase [Streptomyces netropsis]|uniref:alpha/beta fold hydrolase n=1 Tax=Streptomyces netropsis TaxID=55404 RepID=UPI0030CDA638
MSQLLTVDLPVAVHAHRLRTSRGSFAVIEAPPHGDASRATALLVPGFTGSKEDFIPLLEPLAAAGLRVVAMDGRGQHETGGPREAAPYGQTEVARDVIAVTEALGEGPTHLVGHSYGGLVARAAVLGAAARGAVPWASLTVMNSGPAAVSEQQRERLRMLITALGSVSMEDIWEFIGRSEADGVPAKAAEFMRRRWLNNVPDQLRAAGVQMIEEPDRTEELARIAVPKMVISGSPDATWDPSRLSDMAERLSAVLLSIPGAGHSPNVHRPEEVAAGLLAFWNGRP